ncbi:hypothetical protein [Streptococcus thoraltensis]|uniref:hypothetical protein n=1 Tax=Streptococcus thoraltensis TaxID=55085 RepID=UPI001F570785|nr:hypothetical protein [Streptococcus thoraltensis]
MTELQLLTEKLFKQLKSRNISPEVMGQPLHKEDQEELERYRKRLKAFESGYDGLKNLIVKSLLSHQLTLSEIPQNYRMNVLESNGYFSVAAHRYATSSGDVSYLTDVLSIMYDDAIYGASCGILNAREFYELIRQWLNYLDYDKIAFKGDVTFECYFQKQKERHRELFEAFGL